VKLSTRWLILHVPDWPSRLSVELSVDTVSKSVVEAIEQAAERNGIELRRLPEEVEWEQAQ
jgi:hypothetical protein